MTMTTFQLEGKMPIISMPWASGSIRLPLKSPFVEVSFAGNDKLDADDKAGQLLMAINRVELKYRFFDEDGSGLDTWTNLDGYYTRDTLHLRGVIVSAWDVKNCKASTETRARFFSELIAAATTVEIAYPRDDPIVRALLATEAGEEIRRLLCNVICAYRAGVMHTMLFEFFVGNVASEDESNPRLTIKGPGAVGGNSATPLERWDAILDVKTGCLRRTSLDVLLTGYRHACRSEQAVFLQLPVIDYSAAAAANDRGRNDIRVWRDEYVQVLLRDCGFAVTLTFHGPSQDEERKLALYFNDEPRARYGFAYLLTCDARKMDACLAALKHTGYLPEKYWLERSPVNHTSEHSDLARARDVFFHGGSWSMNWKPLPLYKHRFYEKFAALVRFVLAMHTLGLPAVILDELLLWKKHVGSQLLRADRIRAIESTLASCRRVLGARSASVVRERKTNEFE